MLTEARRFVRFRTPYPPSLRSGTLSPRAGRGEAAAAATCRRPQVRSPPPGPSGRACLGAPDTAVLLVRLAPSSWPGSSYRCPVRDQGLRFKLRISRPDSTRDARPDTPSQSPRHPPVKPGDDEARGRALEPDSRGLVPAIHAARTAGAGKAWMAGTSPAMTSAGGVCGGGALRVSRGVPREPQCSSREPGCSAPGCCARAARRRVSSGSGRGCRRGRRRGTSAASPRRR